MRWALPALAVAACLAGPARAQDAAPPPPPAPFAVTLPEKLADVPGTWDLSRDGTNRRCVLTLTMENGDAGRRLRFPAGCRRALPVMGGVAGWLFADGGVRLVDRNVRPLLAFASRPDRRSLVARAESGEVYSLVPLEIATMRPPEPPAAARAPAEPARAGTEPPPVADESGGQRPAPGLYALDRYRDRDVCRLDLGAGANAPVRIVEGCRDSGLEIFDPAFWSYAGGKMTLKSKRGHTVDLVPMGDGRWRREPETGTTFVLRRIEP